MIKRARQLRRKETPSEAMLWQALRGRNVLGTKWRRQQPIGPFVVDFFCAELRLVLEIDGGPIHRSRDVADRARQRALEESDLRVVRVRASDVEEDLPLVLDRLAKLIG